jgi:hypothetical protein
MTLTWARLTWARLTLRLSRFELLAFGGAIVLFTVLTALAAVWIASLRPPPECLSTLPDAIHPLKCEALGAAWYNAQGSVAGLGAGLLIFISFAAGLFLGVPIVAREVERGTTRLAWSLAPSRMRWFVARMVPILVVLGLLIASRAIFIFAVGVAVGAIFARALPAVILTAIIATIGLAGGERVHQMILASEAIAIPIDQQTGEGGGKPGDMYIDQKFVLPDGTLVGWEYFNGEANGPYDDQGNPKFPQVAIVVPGERFRFVETREALALAAGSVVALLLAGFVVSRRRPG